jgi:hypothetical protein
VSETLHIALTIRRQTATASGSLFPVLTSTSILRTNNPLGARRPMLQMVDIVQVLAFVTVPTRRCERG